MKNFGRAAALAFFLAWCSLVGGSQAFAQEAAEAGFEVKEDTVRYASGADTVSALLYRPAVDSALPGVVVIHEWWGLNDWIKEAALRLARRGYVALAIDLYRGHVAGNAEEAHELMRGVPEDRVARDLKSAVGYLRSQAFVDGKRIGSVGWCMGGGYSLQTALVVPDLAACVICYGRLVSEDSTIQTIGAPVFGIFGSEDRGIPKSDVSAFQERARKLGKRVTMEVYEGVGHAFMNPGNQSGYNEAAATRAWERILGFLDAELAAPSGK